MSLYIKNSEENCMLFNSFLFYLRTLLHSFPGVHVFICLYWLDSMHPWNLNRKMLNLSAKIEPLKNFPLYSTHVCTWKFICKSPTLYVIVQGLMYMYPMVQTNKRQSYMYMYNVHAHVLLWCTSAYSATDLILCPLNLFISYSSLSLSLSLSLSHYLFFFSLSIFFPPPVMCVNVGAINLPFPAWIFIFIVIGVLLILGVILFVLIKVIISILVSTAWLLPSDIIVSCSI